jgi:hypothetical protein
MNTMKYLYGLGMFMWLFTACTSSGGGNSGSAPEVNYKKHTVPADLSKLEMTLRGDTAAVDPSYDLYFDFSSTMKRAVSDKVYSDLITSAIFESDGKTNCYIIGENPALKAVQGDNNVRKNTFLNAQNYKEKNTFMTANMNNIVANTRRPAIMFTDFSVDEKNPTTDMNGVTSAFIRGPEFKPQFAEWFNNGGSVRIYGKRSSVEGQNMPIYVIAFIPDGMEPGHKANNILNMLEQKLRDIYFNLHPDFVAVDAVPNDVQLSDYLGFSQKKGGQLMENGLGEVLIYDGGALLSKIKKDSKQAAVTFFDGLSCRLDSTSFYAAPEFSLEVNEYVAESKEKLSIDLKKPAGFFKGLSLTADNKFQIPLVTSVARLDKYYQNPRFFRIAIMAKAGRLNLNDAQAAKDLAYNLKSGGKSLLNNCLYESVTKGLDDALRNNKPQAVYTICAFVKGPSGNL